MLTWKDRPEPISTMELDGTTAVTPDATSKSVSPASVILGSVQVLDPPSHVPPRSGSHVEPFMNMRMSAYALCIDASEIPPSSRAAAKIPIVPIAVKRQDDDRTRRLSNITVNSMACIKVQEQGISGLAGQNFGIAS